MASAFGKSGLADDNSLLIRVPRAGGTVTIPPPTAELPKKIKFGAYVKGSKTAVEGTIRFVGANPFKVGGSFRNPAQIKFHDDKIRLVVNDMEVKSGIKHPFDAFGNGPNQITLTGTLTVKSTTTSLNIDRLIVSEDLTLAGSYYIEIDNGLIVKSGATLTLKTRLYLDLKRGGPKDTKNVLTVDGKITGSDVESDQDIITVADIIGRGFRGTAADKRYYATDEYDPSDGVNHEDCLRITGSGSITDVWFQLPASGNVCYELSRGGKFQVEGSIKDASDDSRNISTDMIFREDVEIEEIWTYGDARVVFEKTAMIGGDIIMEDVTLDGNWTPGSGTPAGNIIGYQRDASVRTGGTRNCAYVGDQDRKGASHIPGFQFVGRSTIGGDLDIRSARADSGTGATQKCAPRVLFLASEATATTPAAGLAIASSVEGDVVIEDTASFGGKGRVYLDSDVHGTGTAARRTAHNVQVGGDLVAKSNTIGMASPSMSNLDGMCTGEDLSLSFGNHLVLTDAAESVIIGDATNGLTLGALVTRGDLRVESGKGPLTVTTLHVGSGAELMSSKDVKVTESLILQGELSGELDEASTIKKLTYGSRNTDLVKKAALTNMLDALSISVGSGELRLDEAYETKNLGLCSGTLSLVDVESTTDSTLHVTEQITVQNGMLAKDTNDPGSLSTDIANATRESPGDRYMLKYITPGKREVTAGDLEWFDPKDVGVDHKDAEITASGDRSIIGKLTITRGKLMVDGMLTVGTSSLDRGWYNGNVNVDKYSVVVTAGELHTKGQDMLVQGRVTVKGKSKLMTGGGDLQVLGRVEDGQYAHNTAKVLLDNKEAVVDLGEGTLLLGPADTKKRNNLRDESGYNTGGGSGVTSRPDASLTLTGSLTAGMIKIPKGSKETIIDVRESSDDKLLETVVFDGTKTPGTGNGNGTLYLRGSTTAGKMLTVDSLSAMQGSVETSEKKVVITKAVALRSATLFLHSEMTEFMGDVMVSGTGGLNADMNKDTEARSVLIHGDFTQRKGTTSGDLAGVKLDSTTTKTVMGKYMVDSDSVRYVAEPGSRLILHGDFHFARSGKLGAMAEFTGKKAQMVQTGAKTELHSVTVDNSMGLKLASDIMQQQMATLTLRRGRLHSMPMDSMFMWTVQNVDVEQELRGRLSAQEGEKCGADNNEACQATILRGSSQSYVGGPVVRHLLQGTAGAGFESGGYLYPVGTEEVGTEKDTVSYYRPLILQLSSDLVDTTAATVSLTMAPEGEMPKWPVENIVVPRTGGDLTLDVHAPFFWKIDLGEEDLQENTNIRLAAAGLRNVADVQGLRIVQWDCMWKNPKLAGRVPAQADAGSFAINGYLNGVVHLTQEGVGLESCAILGIAANGAENPIDQADLSGGRANLQFIHNVPTSEVVDLHLGEIRIGSGIGFRSATAYRPVGAGSHELRIQSVGAPAEQAITSMLSLMHDRNYVVIAHGSQEDTRLKVLETRMQSQVSNHVDVLLVHGSADLGAARVQVLDPLDPSMVEMMLAGNLMLNEATRRYASLSPSQQVIQVMSADQEVTEAYELNLYGYADQTLVLNLSGTKEDLTILGIDRNGMVVPTMVVTGTEEEEAELPKEFALHGNYPNPFNPGTRIQFDLPESAQVSVQVVDLLGREVMVLPAQEVEAGANRSIELHAASLASGTYLYRLMATGAEHRHMKTGRMTLVK